MCAKFIILLGRQVKNVPESPTNLGPTPGYVKIRQSGFPSMLCKYFLSDNGMVPLASLLLVTTFYT